VSPTDFVRRASLRRGDVARMQAQLAKTEAREALKPAWRAFHQAQDISRLSLAVGQTIDRVRSLQQQIVTQAREMRLQVSRRLGNYPTTALGGFLPVRLRHGKSTRLTFDR